MQSMEVELAIECSYIYLVLKHAVVVYTKISFIFFWGGGELLVNWEGGGGTGVYICPPTHTPILILNCQHNS